jgi:GT2 family glycosyltransferase
LSVLVDQMRRPDSRRIAALSPTLRGSGNSAQRVVWPFPTPARAWLEAVGLGRIFSRRTFLIGAVLMLRWEAICEVGLFDERFFLYAEETDWQRRAGEFGWASAVCVQALAEHHGAGTSASPLHREALFHAAQETYIRKWHGASGWWLYRSAATLGSAARAVVLTGERSIEAKRRAGLYFRGPRRCAALVGK